MPMIAIALVLIIAMSASSCVHEFPFQQGDVDSNTVIVEGYITNELKRHTIKISRLNSYYDTTVNEVTSAFVSVTSGSNTYFYHNNGDGTYESDESFVGIVGNVYYLHIELDSGRVVLAAESTMQPVTPPDKITYKIREHSMQKPPYILVVGDKEKQAGAVAVRGRGNTDLGVMPLDAFIARIKADIDAKA